MQREKVSITLPRPVREQLENQRHEMSRSAGYDLTLSQAAQALLQRAMEQKTDFVTGSAG